jgi:hypothetical protein
MRNPDLHPPRNALPSLYATVACTDRIKRGFHTGEMNVHFSPEIQAKLDRAAAEQGRKTESLIQEAVERLLNYEEWLCSPGG